MALLDIVFPGAFPVYELPSSSSVGSLTEILVDGATRPVAEFPDGVYGTPTDILAKDYGIPDRPVAELRIVPPQAPIGGSVAYDAVPSAPAGSATTVTDHPPLPPQGFATIEDE